MSLLEPSRGKVDISWWRQADIQILEVRGINPPGGTGTPNCSLEFVL